MWDFENLESNTGFIDEDTLGFMMNQQAISFQAAALDSSSEMIPMDGYFAHPSMIFLGNSSIFATSPASTEPGNSCGSSFLLGSVARVTNDTGLAVEWSVEEQYILKDGLEKYKKEPNILKYIKIAATLPDKTVRDVALRSRWMQRKRRKPEELYAGRKVKSRKDKLVESSFKMNMPSDMPQNMAADLLTMHHLDQNQRMPSEGIFGTTMHLLKQNSQVFNQITSNLSECQLQDNIDLFVHAKNNIAAMLNDMRDMPGLMSHMLPLPVSVNEDLANSMMGSATQAMILGSPSGINLKQEPRC